MEEEKELIIMRRAFCVILMFYTLAFSNVGYSLSELIDSVYKHSHLVAVANMMIEQNISAIEEAQRNMLPQIHFRGNFDHAITPLNPMGRIGDFMTFTEAYRATLPNPFSPSLFNLADMEITTMLDQMMSELTHVPQNTLSGGLDFRQTFFAQRKLRLALKYARSRGRGLICQWQEARMLVKANITRKYYSALIAQRRTQIEQRSRDIAQSRHSETVLRFELEQLSELDTLNSFIDFSQARIRLREAQRLERENFRAIAVAAGLRTSADSIVLTDTLLHNIINIDYDLLMHHFLARNKELRMLTTAVDLASLQVRMARGDYLPVVFGGLALNRVANFTGRSDFSFEPERVLYFGITYDITPFGQRGLRVKQREFDLRIARRNLERRKEELTLVLTSYYEQLAEEILKIEESRNMRNAAENAFALAQTRYQNGLISQADMETAEQKFRSSDLAYLQAVFSYNSVLIDLRIIGADYLFDTPRNIENERFDFFDKYYLRD
ncbi:MAG: TolC family protein [Chitinivibrionia bacterium]|nr:TolC family protein [Chitinivibrionia bacterium]